MVPGTNLWKTCITGEMQCTQMTWEMGTSRPNNGTGMKGTEKKRESMSTAYTTKTDALDTMTKIGNMACIYLL